MTTIPSIGNVLQGAPPASSNPAPHVAPSVRSTAPAQAEGGSSPSGVASVPANGASQANREDVERAVQQIRKAVEPMARNLQFSIDEETGRTVVKIVDTSTKEVIRQIPSEELLEIAHALDKAVGDAKSGLFVKQKA